jgi:hypothetical protein
MGMIEKVIALVNALFCKRLDVNVEFKVRITRE